MKICRVCKIENEDRFSYCKNCGNKFDIIMPQPANAAVKGGYAVPSSPVHTEQGVVSGGLVPVTMVLPDPSFPDYRTAQTVYVTPAQKAAIEYTLARQSSTVPPPVPAQPVAPVVPEPENTENK